LKNVNI